MGWVLNHKVHTSDLSVDSILSNIDKCYSTVKNCKTSFQNISLLTKEQLPTL